MKKIGIIGGSGPLASALLYEMIIEEAYQHTKDIPEIIIVNYPFTSNPDEVWSNNEVLIDKILYCCNKLIACNIDIAILACNTLHYYLKSLPPINLKFLSLPKLVLKKAEQKKLSSLLVLGSGNTCDYGLYKHPNINIIYPPQDEQKLINGVIDDIIRKGMILQSDSSLLSEVIEKLEKVFSFDGVVLACTDFSVLHDRFPIDYKGAVLDSLHISAKEAVTIC